MANDGGGTLSSGELRAHFQAQGQGHVFAFWDELDAAGRERLCVQARSLDLPALLRAFRATRAAQDPGAHKLEPLSVERLPEFGGSETRFERAVTVGRERLAQGRVAVMVVAGGQATRLGYDGPKGTFPMGPLTDRTLFEQQAQKIRRLRETSGQPVPWYVMTSEATDARTREAFERASHFDLPPGDVVLFSQGMVPSFDFEERLILDAPGHIFQNPDGHGGSLIALAGSGALDDMDRRGIETIFYYQVDNPLVRIADPAFLGFHAEKNAEMSCKVVRKVDPSEKVGVLARIDGHVGVVEYTEIDDEHREVRDASGQLVYWAGNMAIHAFETSFVRRVAERADEILPFHASAKKIPSVDAQGRRVAPSEPNGHKLERFVFDALAATDRVCVVETRRGEEYSPVKNAEGVDSPATARRDLVACYRAWLDAAGIELPPLGTLIEIDHSRVDGPEDARSLGIRRIEEAGDVIRTGAGDQA